MVKKIIKEVLIILLISVLIGLVLAIIFYNYVPSNKLVPSKVTAYSTPENVQKEIEDNTTEQEITQVNKTFEITDSDLSLYKKNKSYNPGKADPFATAETTSEANNTTNNGTSNGNSANGGGDNVDRNTTDNYYNAANISTGTK